MITPLKPQKFNELIPSMPTSDQYQYYWGSSQDAFRRVLISVALLIVFSLLYSRTPDTNWGPIMFICAGLGGLYWMMAPVAIAGIRNSKLRKYSFCGFWQARVLDIYVSEEVLSQQESFSDRGRLEIVHNTETFLNLEVGDRSGFTTTVRVPMRREYKRIKRKQMACMLLFANDPSFNRIAKTTTDIFLPQVNVWVSEYPYLRRDAFIDLTKYLINRQTPASPTARRR
ncbi:hypothetical protein Pse7367_0844 [Thalassoporum mexicanum PCC 7367]|uniref:hypothetical protein n=1 Tax=Thalassoporum mexicanum TaxID=3457544 RepID=UPI00029F9612|nr:hypothetical protein [Pseudanabaena sp. PCC 7367]AFY69144.1 hypothetical protein Pse7367_0844 [Pseudanabaena sp. PCC 7367]